MKRNLSHLLASNKNWAEKIKAQDPTFFTKLSEQQSPEYLWIGCSDSRVPATEIVNLLPGEIFVHRNIANMVIHTDLNCLSVLQYAVDILKVKHVMVVGHYSCGGIRAALSNQENGLIDNWLRHIQDVHRSHKDKLNHLDHEDKVSKLCELNVIEQVINVGNSSVVQNAWKRDQPLSIHGWVYGVKDGIIHDLEVTLQNLDDLQTAIQNLDN